MSNIVRRGVNSVRKDAEYEAFINMVEEGTIPDTWEMVAAGLGVHPNTIKKWRKLPEFQKAKAEGIQDAIRQMQTSGKKDWKMWREKLNLLGAAPSQETTNIQINVIPILGGRTNEVSGNDSHPEDTVIEEADTSS